MARAGKYDHITKHLPRLIGGAEALANPKYQEKVNAVKDAILAPLAEDESPAASIATQAGTVEYAMQAIHKSLLRRCAGRRHATELAAAYVTLRDVKEQIAIWESNTNLLLEAYAQLMLEQMEVESVRALDILGRPLSTSLEPYPTVKDKAACRAWVMRECAGCAKPKAEHTRSTDGRLFDSVIVTDLVTGQPEEVIHYFTRNDLLDLVSLSAQTLAALVKKMLIAGEAPPPGIEVWSRHKIRLGGGDSDDD